MFVLEALQAPRGICMAADRERAGGGYLVDSRLRAVWHLMNVCVDTDQPTVRASQRSAQRCSSASDDPHDEAHVEVRRPTTAIALYDRSASAVPAAARRYYQDKTARTRS